MGHAEVMLELGWIIAYSLVLAVSGAALVVAIWIAHTGAPAKTQGIASNAQEVALRCVDQLQALRDQVQVSLNAISDERERAAKSAGRARAERQRAEGINSPVPATRDELLSGLREKAGLI